MNRTKRIIYLISFMDMFAVGLIYPLIDPIFKSLGASNFLAGLASSTYSGIQILSGPLIGSFSDVLDRKVVLSVLVTLCGICYLSLSLVNSILFLFIIRGCLGLVKHTQSMCRIMITDLFPSEKHAEVLSRSSALSSVGFIIGPFIGGLISEYQNGFAYVCVLTSILFAVNVVLVYRLPNFKNKNKDPSTQKNLKGNFFKIFQNFQSVDWKNSWQIFIIRFLFGTSTSLYFLMQMMYFKEYFKLSQKEIGYILSFNNFIQTCSVFSLNYILFKFYKNDKTGLKRLFHFFCIFCGACSFLLLTDKINYYVVTMIPLAISIAVLRISSVELMLRSCDKEQRGIFSGVSNSFRSIGRFITPMIAGLAGDTLSSYYYMLLPIVPALLGTLVTFNLYQKSLLKKNK